MGLRGNINNLLKELKAEEEELRIEGRMNIARADQLAKVILSLEGITQWEGETGEFEVDSPTRTVNLMPGG